MGKKKRYDPSDSISTAWQKMPKGQFAGSCEFKGKEHHTQVYRSMLRSPAYIALSNDAKAVYMTLRDEFDGVNRTVMCPYSDIERYAGVAKYKIKSLLNELFLLGFIELGKNTERNKAGKVANTYTFSIKWWDITEEQAKDIKNTIKKSKQNKNKRSDIFKNDNF